MRPELTRQAQWQALRRHFADIGPVHMRTLFAADPTRAERFSAEAAGLFLDYSRQRITADTRRLLCELAEGRALRRHIEAMFRGDPINTTERRAALHVALRAPAGERIVVDGRDVVADVHAMLERMSAFADAVRNGTLTGSSGKPIRNIVNIGIGGSDLGPAMAYEALRAYSRHDLRFRFVSNVDATDLAEALRDLDAAETLFIVCSKTFTTQETLSNAKAARRWCADALGTDAAIARHFVAVSADAEKAAAFGIPPARIFGLWDWVGGRYSMASAVGLSTLLAIGPAAFREMLAGMHAIDVHFRHAPFDSNLPVLMGLLAVWNNNFLDAATVAVLPEAEEVDIDIPTTDIRVDTYRSSGAGGQHVNTTDSAVRVTHLPTGIVVTSSEKSQHQNRARAMQVLRARLYDLERQKLDDARAASRKGQVGSGDRSERIRTYNFPQGRLTDHRVGLTLYKLDQVMQGDLGEVIDALVAADQASRLADLDA